MTNVIARLRYLPITPRKVNLVARLVQGLEVEAAKAQMRSLTKRAVVPLEKLLNSAIANAGHNFHLADQIFIIKQIRVSQGPMSKRGFPRSRGRADIKRKRTSHVTIVLEEKSAARNLKSETIAKS